MANVFMNLDFCSLYLFQYNPIAVVSQNEINMCIPYPQI